MRTQTLINLLFIYAGYNIFTAGRVYQDNLDENIWCRIFYVILYYLFGMLIILGYVIWNFIIEDFLPLTQIRSYLFMWSGKYKKFTIAQIASSAGVQQIRKGQKGLTAKHQVYTIQLLINKWKKYNGIKSMHKNKDTGEWKITYVSAYYQPLNKEA
jgi:hypothetical protein